MYQIRIKKTLSASLIGIAALLFVCAGCPNWPNLTIYAVTPFANWGVGSLAPGPNAWPNSTQVMMTPTVIDLGEKVARVVFVSFETGSDAFNDGNGVLRVVDDSGNEIARFPDPNHPVPIPASCTTICPALATVPHLSPVSGLALGRFPPNQTATIIGVLDDHATSHAGIVAFQLVGGYLAPQWCSQLIPGDTIPRISAPAIAQLDASGPPSIIIENKVYDASGSLRYSGGPCLTCPRSRTPVVANLTGAVLPQIITGDAIYTPQPGPLTWQNPTVTLLPGLHPILKAPYPAVADLDNNTTPEIIVTDAAHTFLHIFSAMGTALASTPLPNTSGNCGGPPMIADLDGIPGLEIGVATCSNYTVFKFSNNALSQVWTQPISDPSGTATSTMFKDPNGVPRIYYADSTTLWVFRGSDGAILQSMPNPSGTAIEGPIIASFNTAPAPPGAGRLIFSASNFPPSAGGTTGLRIFTGSAIGPARSVWNQHTYHQTNISNSFGDIPVVEPPSWQATRNTYRVQQ